MSKVKEYQVDKRYRILKSTIPCNYYASSGEALLNPDTIILVKHIIKIDDLVTTYVVKVIESPRDKYIINYHMITELNSLSKGFAEEVH